MSDEVPLSIPQVVQSVCLRSKFLHPVLAENAQAGGIRLADALYRKRFAHAHQRNFVWITARPSRRCCDSLLHPDNIFRNRHKRSEEHTSELQSHLNLVCRLLLEKKK